MHLKPKKSLGQHFLIDKNIQKKIIDCLQLQPSDTVLEIGSGRGELTGLISCRVNRVYALEIDPLLCATLNENLKSCLNVSIINKDILKFDFKKYFKNSQNKKEKIKVFGNIPYYISSPIIEYLSGFRNKIATIFITVQKEFAKRIIACPGSKDYGAFSCFVQYYFEPQVILNIKKTCFSPSPKVDSSLLKLEIRTKPLVKPKDKKLFFKIIRTAFNKRRKILKNSLAGIIPAQKLEDFFCNYSIDKKIRPENLSLEDFANLVNI